MEPFKVVNLDILTQLLNDRELRGQVSRLLANKVRADVKSLETNGMLSRQLLQAAARAQRGDAAVNGVALRAVVKEHLDFYESLVNQTLAFNQRLAERLHGLGAPMEPAPAQATMRLQAPLHSTVRAAFRLENNRHVAIVVGFEITPFVSEAGSGIVSTDVAFDPPTAELKPGQETKIEMSIAVAAGFAPGTTYLATVSVKGLDATQLLVRLAVLPAATDAAAVRVASEAPRVTPAATGAAAQPVSKRGAPATAARPRKAAAPRAAPGSPAAPARSASKAGVKRRATAGGRASAARKVR
jgi:hypothetical protein